MGLKEGAELAGRVRSTPWYHTIELPDGIVTPGYFDLRGSLSKLPFPYLGGKRCLDVGTSDGFWAFEMERQGAAEVVAIDLDDPSQYDWPGQPPSTATRDGDTWMNSGFALAHSALRSKVTRVACSVYDLDRSKLGGFDFVFMGALLLHLRDPMRALAAIRSVTDGKFLSTDVISLPNTVLHPFFPAVTFAGRVSRAAAFYSDGEPLWWTPNLVAYRRMIRAADFRIVLSGRPYAMSFGEGYKARAREDDSDPAERPRLNRMVRRFGVPAAWVLCEPE